MNLVPFDSRNLIYKNPFGAVKSGDEVAFRVVLENDNEVIKFNDKEIYITLTAILQIPRSLQLLKKMSSPWFMK